LFFFFTLHVAHVDCDYHGLLIQSRSSGPSGVRHTAAFISRGLLHGWLIFTGRPFNRCRLFVILFVPPTGPCSGRRLSCSSCS
jgi:hypothetical protein